MTQNLLLLALAVSLAAAPAAARDAGPGCGDFPQRDRCLLAAAPRVEDISGTFADDLVEARFTFTAGRLVAGRYESALRQAAFKRNLTLKLEVMGSRLLEKDYGVSVAGPRSLVEAFLREVLADAESLSSGGTRPKTAALDRVEAARVEAAVAAATGRADAAARSALVLLDAGSAALAGGAQ